MNYISLKLAMNSRERVITALEHKEPDRVPIDIGHVGPHADAFKRLKAHLGLELSTEDVPGRFGMLSMDPKLLKRIHVDFRRVQASGPPIKEEPDGTLQDFLGLRRKKTGGYWWIVEHPLANASDVSDIRNYRWPDTSGVNICEGVETRAKHLDDDGWAVVSDFLFTGPYNMALWLRGDTQFARDIYQRPDIANAILDEISRIQLELYSQFLDCVSDYALIVSVDDDFGTQSGLFLSPQHYRKFIKPRQMKLFHLIHNKTDAKILLHTCGTTTPLIGDFVDLALDIVNPMQPCAKLNEDSFAIKRDFGDKICFHGGIDTQRVLPFGDAEGVESEVKYRIKAFAPNGGYILAPSQSIQSDVPTENVLTLFDAAFKYGRYPIDL